MSSNKGSNITDFPSESIKRRPNDKSGGPSNTGNGSGTGGGDLEKRIETLEKAIPDIRERLARVETKLDNIDRSMVTKADIANFATKDDLQKLSVDVLKAINDQTWKFIGVAAGLAGLAFTAARFIPGG